jgi:hypothetical protein
MYEVRSLWVPKMVLTKKQETSKDFQCCPKIGPWTLGPNMLLTLSDDEFLMHHGTISKLVGCDCVKYRKLDPREGRRPRLVVLPESLEAPRLPADPTQPPG